MQHRDLESFKINVLGQFFVSGSGFKKWKSQYLLNAADSSFVVDLPDDFLYPSRPWNNVDW